MTSIATAPALVAAVDERRAVRRLSAAALVTACGNGAWYTCWALFLTRAVGLSPAQVGIGITAAGVVGLLASAPLGALADRFGPKALLVPLSVVQAAAFVAYLAVHSFLVFLPVAVATVATDRGATGVRAALALSLSRGRGDLRTLAVVRVANSSGFALGSALGAVAIALDTRSAYAAIALVNAATYLAYAATVASLPSASRDTSRAARAGAALRDLPYLTLAAITGVLALCWGMLSSGIPLWVARHTHAPLWISAAIVFVNALTIAALQIPITRRVASPLDGARAARRAGSALALACVVLALTSGRGGATALSLLLAAAAIHVTGELLFVAAAWRLSVDLMPPHAPGEYQGVFATGQATAQMLAPAVMTTLVVGWGAPGWIVLGALFALGTLPAPAATRWALRTRATMPRDDQ